MLSFFLFQIEFISVQFVCIVIFISDIQPYMYLHKFTKRRTKIKFEPHLANRIFRIFHFSITRQFSATSRPNSLKFVQRAARINFITREIHFSNKEQHTVFFYSPFRRHFDNCGTNSIPFDRND